MVYLLKNKENAICWPELFYNITNIKKDYFSHLLRPTRIHESLIPSRIHWLHSSFSSALTLHTKVKNVLTKTFTLGKISYIYFSRQLGVDLRVAKYAKVKTSTSYGFVRAIFVWPWNKNARTKQTQQTNGQREIWLVYRTDTNARGFWLVRPIKQCLLHIRVFFGGKTKSPWFDLFIHWLIKQITNTYRNHFSRSHENRSIVT